MKGYVDRFLQHSEVHIKIQLRKNETYSKIITSIPERHCDVVALDNKSNLGYA
jgi:hypothetical protein